MTRSASQSKLGIVIATAWMATCVFTPSAFCDSSGLNNIPTADTAPDRAIVFQFKPVISDETHSLYFAGFKMGFEQQGQRFEWGVDGPVGVGSLWNDAGPAVFQLKYSLEINESTALGLGVANLGVRDRDREDMGQAFKYGVLSHDFGSFRAHAGYGLQHSGNTALLGLDTTIELLNRDLMLRADLIQIDDEDQWLGSLGFIYFIDEHFAFESWVSQPFESGEPSFTIKFNFVIPF